MGRGLEGVDPSVNEAGELVLTCMCDCATVTCVTIGGSHGRLDLVNEEFAVTCDGCGTSHWITARATLRSQPS